MSPSWDAGPEPGPPEFTFFSLLNVMSKPDSEATRCGGVVESGEVTSSPPPSAAGRDANPSLNVEGNHSDTVESFFTTGCGGGPLLWRTRMSAGLTCVLSGAFACNSESLRHTSQTQQWEDVQAGEEQRLSFSATVQEFGIDRNY